MIEHAEMTTADKIKAIEQSGFPLAWDGCHKIYFLEDDASRDEAKESGYSIFVSSAVLKKLIRDSCWLVFVSRWGRDNDDFEHRWNIEQGAEDIREAAGEEH